MSAQTDRGLTAAGSSRPSPARNRRRLGVAARILVLGLGIVAVAGAGYIVVGGGPSVARSERPPAPSQSPMIEPISAQAVAVPSRWAVLSASVGGRVEEMLVAEGQIVEADELLLRVRSVAADDAVALAQAQLAGASAALDRAEAERETVPEFAPQSERRAADSTVALAEADVAAAMVGVQVARHALEAAEIRAPFAGIIVEVHAEAGQQLAEGEVVAVLADVSRWIVETVDLDETAVVRLAPGMPATVTFAAFPELRLSGTVSRVSLRAAKTALPQEPTYAVQIRLDEPDPRLRWGLSARVRIEPDE